MAPLSGFPMFGVGITETAEFFDFHTVGMFFLILGGLIVALLARHAGQGDFSTHVVSSLS
jgi:hypothetical protein